MEIARQARGNHGIVTGSLQSITFWGRPRVPARCSRGVQRPLGSSRADSILFYFCIACFCLSLFLKFFHRFLQCSETPDVLEVIVLVFGCSSFFSQCRQRAALRVVSKMTRGRAVKLEVHVCGARASGLERWATCSTGSASWAPSRRPSASARRWTSTPALWPLGRFFFLLADYQHQTNYPCLECTSRNIYRAVNNSYLRLIYPYPELPNTMYGYGAQRPRSSRRWPATPLRTCSRMRRACSRTSRRSSKNIILKTSHLSLPRNVMLSILNRKTYVLLHFHLRRALFRQQIGLNLSSKKQVNRLFFFLHFNL